MRSTSAFRGLLAALPLASLVALPGCDGAPGDAGSPAGAGTSGSAKRRNVVLISVDMLRPDHLSCYGYARKTSPSIDRLAEEGALFETHVSSTSWTLPAHAALFTSLPDSLHGCTDTDKALSAEAVTLAERFAEAGYQTAGFFSGPYLHPAFGLAQGFQRYEDCASYRDRIDAHPPSEWAMDASVMRASHEDVTSPRVHAAVTRWIGAREGRPFFLFVHLWDPHFDFVPPPPYDTQFDPDYRGSVTGRGFWFDASIDKDMDPRDLQHLVALYDGEIAWTDSFIGKLRDELERAGILDETVLAVTSDHGTEFFEHGDKGHRKTLYDEVIRIPLVVRAPGLVTAGRRVTEQTRMVDVGPTLMELAGLPAPSDVVGFSLLPAVKGVRSPAEGAMRARAVSELYSVGRYLRAVRTPRWKLVDDLGNDTHWYFDLGADPGEKVRLQLFDSELGQTAERGYLAEVAALDAFMNLHPPPASATSSVPLDVEKQLRDLGYVGVEPDAVPAQPPKKN